MLRSPYHRVCYILYKRSQQAQQQQAEMLNHAFLHMKGVLGQRKVTLPQVIVRELSQWILLIECVAGSLLASRLEDVVLLATQLPTWSVIALVLLHL